MHAIGLLFMDHIERLIYSDPLLSYDTKSLRLASFHDENSLHSAISCKGVTLENP